ncbi:MAG: hypothetical protein EBR01_05695 [Proteobacteria bacterium]|nr:hypothetical protein [Pseudomonadota bacterium]
MTQSCLQLIFVLCVMISWTAQGSYRVYQLRVRHYDQTAKKKINRVVLTVMDPVQYLSFNGGPRTMKVDLQDTWYCPGDTSGKRYCKKPKEPVDRGPASLDYPKRTKLPRNLQPVVP